MPQSFCESSRYQRAIKRRTATQARWQEDRDEAVCSGLMTPAPTLFGEHDLFMRAYPPVKGRLREKDLFEGVV